MNSTVAIISLFGAINGFMLGMITLLRYGRGQLRGWYLGALMVSASLVIVVITLEHQGWVDRRAWVYITEETLSLLYGPLLLSFSIASIGRQPPGIWIYAPLLMYLLLGLVSLLFPGNSIHLPLGMENIMWLQIGYFVAAVLMYMHWRTGSSRVRLKMHQISIGYILASLCIIHLAQIARWLFSDVALLRDVVPLTITLCFYLFLVYALLHSRSLKGLSEAPQISDDNQTAEAYQRLLTLMQSDRPYLRTDLDSATLAAMINCSPNQLREVLKNHTDSGFYEFLGQYRLAEAKRLLSDPDEQRYTIEGIARQCGYASRSAFYKAFKADTGNSPADYRRQLLSSG